MDSVNTSLNSTTPLETIPVPKSTPSNTSSSYLDDTINSSNNGIDFILILKYIFIILILGFLGYNLFTYLGGENPRGPGRLVNKNLNSIDTALGSPVKRLVGKNPKQKDIADITSNAKNSGINNLNKNINARKNPRNKIDDNSASVGRAIRHARKQKPSPSADETGSLTQNNKRLKSGFCYIGEDRGVRSCVKVNQSDMCMSGDIFPSHALCLNPNLRE